MRRLNKTVVAGGVVYPAGTAEDQIPDGAIKNPAHWDGNPDPEREPAADDPYKGWKVDQLRNEIDARNTAAGDGETQIEPEAPGNKPELLAALRADDERRAADNA